MIKKSLFLCLKDKLMEYINMDQRKYILKWNKERY